MFGFLNPYPHGPDYRRAYARLCLADAKGRGDRCDDKGCCDTCNIRVCGCELLECL